MSYRTQAILANDTQFLTRVTACAAAEGEENPRRWAEENQWKLSAMPGFDADYSYAIDTGVEDPGNSDVVINDAKILAAVQALRARPGSAPAAQ